MRRLLGAFVTASFLVATLTACAIQPQSIVTTPRTYQGAGAGAAVGAGAGALIDSNNRWRGAVLGGALGAVAGGTMTEISSRAARDAVAEQQAVAYQTRGCRTVTEKVYQNGRLVRTQTRQAC